MLLALALIAYAETPFVDPSAPRCLASPPPDGVYRLPDGTLPCPSPGACVEPILGRPVAVVDGCVGARAGDAWQHGVAVTGSNQFVVVDSDGKRCNSGTTATYFAAGGLTGRAQVWTNCGGGDARDGAPVELARSDLAVGGEDFVAAAFEDAEESVRAAALEAIARKQPEEWTCDPLGRAIRGAAGPEAEARAVGVAKAPCLADDLRVALFDHLYDPAAEALARVSTSPGPLGDDLLRAIDEGRLVDPLALRLVELGVAPSVRAALASAVVDPEGTEATRTAAVRAIDRMLRDPADGEALVAAAARNGSCAGWRALMATEAVKASGLDPPRKVAARCD